MSASLDFEICSSTQTAGAVSFSRTSSDHMAACASHHTCQAAPVSHTSLIHPVLHIDYIPDVLLDSDCWFSRDLTKSIFMLSDRIFPHPRAVGLAYSEGFHQLCTKFMHSMALPLQSRCQLFCWMIRITPEAHVRETASSRREHSAPMLTASRDVTYQQGSSAAWETRLIRPKEG